MGLKILWIFFGGHQKIGLYIKKNWTIFRGHFYAF